MNAPLCLPSKISLVLKEESNIGFLCRAGLGQTESDSDCHGIVWVRDYSLRYLSSPQDKRHG